MEEVGQSQSDSSQFLLRSRFFSPHPHRRRTWESTRRVRRRIYAAGPAQRRPAGDGNPVLRRIRRSDGSCCWLCGMMQHVHVHVVRCCSAESPPPPSRGKKCGILIHRCEEGEKNFRPQAFHPAPSVEEFGGEVRSPPPSLRWRRPRLRPPVLRYSPLALYSTVRSP